MNPVENSCVVHKRFLFWKYDEVVHDYELYSIVKFMYCSTDFIVRWKCSKCAAIKTRKFVSYDELLLKGVSSEILNGITDDEYYFSQNKNKH